MSKSNVAMLAKIIEDGYLWNPQAMLIDASIRARDELPQVKKAVVIFYDESNLDVEKRIKWSQSGLTKREIIDLLTLAKNDLMIDLIVGE